MRPHPHPFPSPRRRQRGSVLIVALLLMAVIALMLASYLGLNLNSTRQAQRAFHGSAALNLAETGAEEAVWSFNRATAGHADAWQGWADDGKAAWRRFDDFDFTRQTRGSVQVYTTSRQPAPGVNPRIMVLASVSPPDGTPLTRMLEVTLRRRSYFASGLVAKDSITFSGTNTSVDSWDSDPDDNPATAAVPYGPGVRRDRGIVASTSFVNQAVLLNHADVWGYVYTGGALPVVGNNGSIRGADTPEDVTVDPNRIATDFIAEFPPVFSPEHGTHLLSVGATLGTVGETTVWRCPAIQLNGNKTLTILGHVTLILTAGPGISALDITGNASILIPEGSSLTVYVEGNVKIAGKGIGNANARPLAFLLWGTAQDPGGQDIQIAGNGALKAAVYAPAADVKINGNGDVMGAVVAHRITLVGNAAFHYDESLARYGDDTPFGIVQWREITADAERKLHTPLFSGW
ncbi:MAG: hypothetical protein KIT44_03065 [Opitutaceae bacterium]|nr:hypothetical protein [Opitutaceae bacterium]